jgi:hypothetical protein
MQFVTGIHLCECIYVLVCEGHIVLYMQSTNFLLKVLAGNPGDNAQLRANPVSH